MICYRLKSITNRSVESIRSSSSRLKKTKKNVKSRESGKNHGVATVFRDNDFKTRGVTDIQALIDVCLFVKCSSKKHEFVS